MYLYQIFKLNNALGITFFPYWKRRSVSEHGD